MIVTTSGRPNDQLIHLSLEIASELKCAFIDRSKKSVEELKIKYADSVLVVGKNRIELHFLNQSNPLFFHPNSAMFRIKRLIKGETDPFCEACNLKQGDFFLDCTLGLASDSIIASYVVGNTGQVKGIEGSKSLAYLVTRGLRQWETGLEPLDEAMKRVHVLAEDHLTVLKSYPDKSVDVIYFDPMFEETIEGSTGLQALKNIANYSSLKAEAIAEASRVSRKRIVLKDHWKSTRFEQFNFKVMVRKSAKFHYGVIDLNE